ncbi:MAG: hypothetical protein ACI9MC_003889 [Kiritimatiellia bacterium]|jgi:hypothetical protein
MYGFQLPVQSLLWSFQHPKTWLYILPYMVLALCSLALLLVLLVGLATTFSVVGGILTAITGGSALCCGQSVLAMLSYSVYGFWAGLNSLYALLLGQVYELAERRAADEIGLEVPEYSWVRALPKQVFAGTIVWAAFFLMFSATSAMISLIPLVGVVAIALLLMLQCSWDYGLRLVPGTRMWSIPESVRWFRSNTWIMVGMTVFLIAVTLITAGVALPLTMPFLVIGASHVALLRQARGDELPRDRRFDYLTAGS